MKLLIISGGYPTKEYPLNGVFAFDQAKGLKEFGHEVLFVSIDLRSIRRKRKFGKNWTTKDSINIIDYSIPLGNFPIPILLFFGKFAINRIKNDILAKFGKPDLIHAHFLTNANIAISLKKYFQVPLVLTEHSSSVNKKILSSGTFKLGQVTYSNADRVICVSRMLSFRLKEHWGINSDIIPNIVDTSLFSYIKKDSKIQDEFTFLSVGNLTFNKGFDLLIDAFKKCKFDSSVSLKIIGQGEYYDELDKRIHKLGLSEQIKLLGFMDRRAIAKEMINSDIFVLSSRSETFGVVYIEAIASGLPVIGTTCGGPEDFITDENGILVPVDDVSSLAEALIYMYSNVDKYNKSKNSDACKLKHSPLNIARQITDIYNEIFY